MAPTMTPTTNKEQPSDSFRIEFLGKASILQKGQIGYLDRPELYSQSTISIPAVFRKVGAPVDCRCSTTLLLRRNVCRSLRDLIDHRPVRADFSFAANDFHRDVRVVDVAQPQTLDDGNLQESVRGNRNLRARRNLRVGENHLHLDGRSFASH